MPAFFRLLLDRLAGRRVRPAAEPPVEASTGPQAVDIVLSELPRDWAESLEAGDPATDYDVRSLGEPIDPARVR